MTASILSRAEESFDEKFLAILEAPNRSQMSTADIRVPHMSSTRLQQVNSDVKFLFRQQLTSAITEVLGAVRLEKKTFPERESDDYDAGYAIAVAEQNRLIEGILKELN